MNFFKNSLTIGFTSFLDLVNGSLLHLIRHLFLRGGTAAAAITGIIKSKSLVFGLYGRRRGTIHGKWCIRLSLTRLRRQLRGDGRK